MLFRSPDWEFTHRVCIYDIAFRLGLRIPLHPFIQQVLSTLGVSPAQLLPQGWRLILGLISLADLNDIDISVGTLLQTYFVKWYNQEIEQGRIAFLRRPKKQSLVILPQMKQDAQDPWRERYFLLNRKCIVGNEGIDFPTNWTVSGM